MALMVFYQFCWKIIKDDLYSAISEFFAGGELTKAWTSTNILPVPKVDNPTNFKHYRPISLCNVCNKILSKLMMERISKVLPHLISPGQVGIVKGRSINDNI